MFSMGRVLVVTNTFAYKRAVLNEKKEFIGQEGVILHCTVPWPNWLSLLSKPPSLYMPTKQNTPPIHTCYYYPPGINRWEEEAVQQSIHTAYTCIHTYTVP